MALGDTKIASIRGYQEDINHLCTNRLLDQWNTFQYVAKNLENWADETTIGAELRSEMITLTETFKSLIDNTQKLLNRINEFVDYQKQINSGM